MNDQALTIIFVVSQLLWVAVVAFMVVSNRQNVSALVDAIKTLQDDTRLTNTVEQAYLNSAEQVKQIINFSRVVIGGLASLLAGTDAGKIADAVEDFLETVTDGEPNEPAPPAPVPPPADPEPEPGLG